MKVSRIPNMGNYGVFVDGFSKEELTDDLWMEIGQLFLKELVVIIRDCYFTLDEYNQRMCEWGFASDAMHLKTAKKYNISYHEVINFIIKNRKTVTQQELSLLKDLSVVETPEKYNGNVLRVCGGFDENNRPKGLFADGELEWHSNECGQLEFRPCVSLMGYRNFTKSATVFCQTADYYESLSEATKSELNEMILVSAYQKGKMNPGMNVDDHEKIVITNMCPDGEMETPLVMKSPGGIMGLHYSPWASQSIKGMSREESQKIFDEIEKNIFKKDNVYEHWYQQDNDLCIFDNSIALHKRLGDTTDRLGYRIQFTCNKLLEEPYNPYIQEEYRKVREEFTQFEKKFW